MTTALWACLRLKSPALAAIRLSVRREHGRPSVQLHKCRGLLAPVATTGGIALS